MKKRTRRPVLVRLESESSGQQQMFAYTVTETPGATVYTLRDVNICCGPCGDVEEDFVSAHIFVDGDTLTEVWRLKPHSGGTYTHWYPAPVRGRHVVFEHVRICRGCNERYMQRLEQLARHPHDLELEQGLARDAQRIVEIIEASGRKDE
jgi:hypothetical protein